MKAKNLLNFLVVDLVILFSPFDVCSFATFCFKLFIIIKTFSVELFCPHFLVFENAFNLGKKAHKELIGCSRRLNPCVFMLLV